MPRRSWVALAALACACATAKTEEKPAATAPAAKAAPAPKPPPVLQVPLAYHHLDNGLKVVLSPDHTAPLVTIALYYNIGFRLEPKGRTGFAHLFEHLMFQASQNLAKQEFSKLVQGAGACSTGRRGSTTPISTRSSPPMRSSACSGRRQIG